MLKQSNSLDDFGTPIWYTTLCLLLAWSVEALALVKGFESLGKVRQKPDRLACLFNPCYENGAFGEVFLT